MQNLKKLFNSPNLPLPNLQELSKMPKILKFPLLVLAILFMQTNPAFAQPSLEYDLQRLQQLQNSTPTLKEILSQAKPVPEGILPTNFANYLIYNKIFGISGVFCFKKNDKWYYIVITRQNEIQISKIAEFLKIYFSVKK